jgi:hypothetical protein
MSALGQKQTTDLISPGRGCPLYPQERTSFRSFPRPTLCQFSLKGELKQHSPSDNHGGRYQNGLLETQNFATAHCVVSRVQRAPSLNDALLKIIEHEPASPSIILWLAWLAWFFANHSCWPCRAMQDRFGCYPSQPPSKGKMQRRSLA